MGETVFEPELFSLLIIIISCYCIPGLGAEISEEKSSKGLEDDLHKIIGVCDACFKDGTDAEVPVTLFSNSVCGCRWLSRFGGGVPPSQCNVAVPPF